MNGDVKTESAAFSQRIGDIIKKIPPGKVATYGQIARYGGDPRATRQVVWVLHTFSEKDDLPWHRVVNSKGQISLKPNYGYELQKALLEKEGVVFGDGDTIDLDKYMWNSKQSTLL